MHYFIFPNKDSYIVENSPGHIIEYPDSTTKNYGGDEILELKKQFVNSYSTSSYNVSRVLLQFDYTEISKSLSDGTITDPRYYLRLYEVEGQKESSLSYVVGAYPLSQSWEEGVGKKYDYPNTKQGVTWQDNNSGSAWNFSVSSITFGSYDSEFDAADSTFESVSGSDYFSSGSRTTGGGVWYYDDGFSASQSFSEQSPDVEMDITDIVNKHLTDIIPNNGIILKYSGSYEHNTSKQNLKFFSRHTHTIYAPKLEVRWNDVSFSTGSLTSLTMNGSTEHHLYIKGLQQKYRETEKVRFRLGCRKKYVQKTFTDSVYSATGSFIPNGNSLYSIVDVATDTAVVPFSTYTSMSCDTNSMYFDQWLNTFEPGRYYKVLFKIKYDDGQEIIVDNDEEFKVI